METFFPLLDRKNLSFDIEQSDKKMFRAKISQRLNKENISHIKL